MSKNLKKKRLHNQVNNLFSDLDQPVNIPGLTVEPSSRGWIWDVDLDGKLVACSPEIEVLLGYKKDEVIGKLISSISNFNVESQKSLKAPVNSSYPSQIVIIFNNKAGEPIDFSVQLFPQSDDEGTMFGWRGIAISMTPEKDPQPAEKESSLASSLNEVLEIKDIPVPDTGSLPLLEKEPDNQDETVSIEEKHDIKKEADPNEEVTELEAIGHTKPLQNIDNMENIFEKTESISDEDNLTTSDLIEEMEVDDPGIPESPDFLDQKEESIEEVTELEAIDHTKPLHQPEPIDEIDEKIESISDKDKLAAPELIEELELDDTGIPESPDFLDQKDDSIEEEVVVSEHKKEIGIHTARLYDIPELEPEDKSSLENKILGDTSDPVSDEDYFLDPDLIEELGLDDPGLPESPVSLDQEEDTIEEEIVVSEPKKGSDIQTSELIELSDLEPEDKASLENQFLEDTSDLLSDERILPSPAQTAPLYLSEEDFARFSEDHTIEGFQIQPTDEEVSEEAKEEIQESEVQQLPDEQIASPPLGTAPLLLDEDQEELLLANIFSNANPISSILNAIDQDPDRDWTEDELLLVEEVSNQLSLALENASLFQQTQTALADTDEQARRLQILNLMGEELGQASNLQEIYDLAVEKTQQIFNADRVSFSLITPDKEAVQIISARGEKGSLAKGSILPLVGTANQTAIEGNKVVISSQFHQDNLGEIQSFILGPVNISGEIIGTINVGSYTPEAFSQRDENIMLQLLSLLGSIVENRRLFNAIEEALSSTEEQARRLSLLNTLSEKLGHANTFDEVLSLTMEDLDKIIPADRCSAEILNPTKNCFEVFTPNQDQENTTKNEDIPIENTLVGLVSRENRLHSIENLGETPYLDTRMMTENGLRSAMVAPLSASGKVIGTISVCKNEANAYNLQDENLMLSISSLVASTMDNRQLLGDIQRRSIQLETSAEVSRVASTILDTNELLPKVVELIKDGFGLYYAGLFLVDEIGEWTGEPNKWAALRAGSGEAGRQMLKAGHKLEINGDSMIGTAIANAEPRIAFDVGEEARFFRNPYLPETRSEMALPLISRGDVLGALSIQSIHEEAFSQEDITSLQTMADQVANTIENAHLFEQTEARAEELAVLNEMARAFTQTLDIDELIDHTYHYVGRLMNADNFHLSLYDEENEEISFKLFIEEDSDSEPPPTKLKLGNGITDWIIRNQQPVLLPDNTEEQMLEMGVELRGETSKSFLGVPMMIGGQVLGVMAVQSYSQPNTYNNRHLDLLSAIANQATVAIDNAKLFHQEQERAQQEHLVRTITDKVRSGSDTQSIMRIALEEIGKVLEANKSTIRLGTKKQLLSEPKDDNSNPEQPFENIQSE